MYISQNIQRYSSWTLCLIAFYLLACEEESTMLIETEAVANLPISLDPDSVFKNYTPLPEQQISATQDSQWLAQYYLPTERYGHGILGDKIEAGGLVMYHDGTYYPYILEDNYVFEDLAPRMIDVNADGRPELLCIRSEVNSGAALVIYELRERSIRPYAWIEEVGTRFRWLNVVAVKDLDNDDTLDLVWIQTPHIGGILKSTNIAEGKMEVLDEMGGVSNHAIGQRNLCLSALVEIEGKLQMIVPNQSRSKLIYVSYQEGNFTQEAEIEKEIDFSQPIYDQLEEEETVNDNNCQSDL